MSQTSNSKSTFVFFSQKLQKEKNNSKLNHKSTKKKNQKKNNQVDSCCQKPPSVNPELEHLHSPAHVSSEGLLQ